MNINSPFDVPERWSYKAQSLLKTELYLENRGPVNSKDGFIFFVRINLHLFCFPWPLILFKHMYLASGVRIFLVGIYENAKWNGDFFSALNLNEHFSPEFWKILLFLFLLQTIWFFCSAVILYIIHFSLSKTDPSP